MEERDVKNQVIRHEDLDKKSDLENQKIFVAYPYFFDVFTAYRPKYLEVEKRIKARFLFADRNLTGQSLLQKIAQQILQSCASIFDLSMWNLNVVAELGLALGLDRKIFILYNPVFTQEQDVPSDLRGIDRVQYKTFEELPGAILKCTYASLPAEAENVVNQTLERFQLSVTPDKSKHYLEYFKNHDFKVRELLRYFAKQEESWFTTLVGAKNWRDLAEKMFQIFLARPSLNVEGLAFWTHQVEDEYNRHKKIDGTIDGFVDSPEYSMTFGDYLPP